MKPIKKYIIDKTKIPIVIGELRRMVYVLKQRNRVFVHLQNAIDFLKNEPLGSVIHTPSYLVIDDHLVNVVWDLTHIWVETEIDNRVHCYHDTSGNFVSTLPDEVFNSLKIKTPRPPVN